MSDIHAYFNNTGTDRIKHIILNAIDHHGYFVDSVYEENVIVSIIIALYRIRDNHYIVSKQKNDLTHSIEYTIANEICRQYSNHWHIHPTKNDIAYMASLLTGQIKSSNLIDDDNKKEVISQSFIDTINDILIDTFQKYMLDIDYSEQLYNFSLHIDAMIKRAKIHRPAENISLNQLKNNSPFIHDVSVYLTQRISEQFQIEIDESEIGFISVHIGYLIKNCLQNNQKVNVILFCDQYHRIAEKIQKALLANLSEFIQLYQVHQLNIHDIHIQNADIITTKQTQIFGKKVVCISPFYNLQDQMKIMTATQECIDQKKTDHFNDLFHTYFHKNLFFIRNDLTNKEEVIRFMG